MSKKEELMTQGEKVTENIWLCPDGVYRWSYEVDMLRNPVIMLTVWKVLGIAFGVVFIFHLVLAVFDSAMTPAEIARNTGMLVLIIGGILLVLSIVSYLILAALYGWKYQVLFEMTDKQVTHIQMPKQFKKAEAIGWLTAFVGSLAGKPYMVALGSNVAVRNTSTSEFESVEVVKVRRKWHTIHVDYLLDKNQVYAEDADFDFVERFILERCVKAKVR